MEDEMKEKDVVVFVDVQRDFIDGKLGSDVARAIVPQVVEFAKRAKEAGVAIYATRDTHFPTVLDEAGEAASGYMASLEGKYLPVEHCIKGTDGWQIIPELAETIGSDAQIIDKETFGKFRLVNDIESSIGDCKPRVYICGVCTDICVISMAVIFRTAWPDSEIYVVPDCCAGSTEAKHAAAIEVMDSCQIRKKDSSEVVFI